MCYTFALLVLGSINWRESEGGYRGWPVAEVRARDEVRSREGDGGGVCPGRVQAVTLMFWESMTRRMWVHQPGGTAGLGKKNKSVLQRPLVSTYYVSELSQAFLHLYYT